MKGFLEEVAQDLYTRYGEQLSNCTMLFPSRRARLFFIDALSKITDKPIWQPQWASMDSLMSELSGLMVGDRMRLVTELYKIYSKYHTEPFDKFYFWGDMLLTDFDTIDKYQVDAEKLFANIHDLEEINADLSYLEDEQRELILKFWSSLVDGEDLSETKLKFLAIWKTLGRIYTEFKEHLTSLGIAYGGMVQRSAAEKIKAGECSFEGERHFVVVGFNALSECEKQLFKFLSTAYKTDFYWDYDNYYTNDKAQESGMFVRQNVANFPSPTALSHDNMRLKKQFTSVATVSNAVQCKYVAEILEKLSEKAPLNKETAIVLTDENLLVPLLYALPKELGEVNVTMGYPLKITLAYTFIERLVELQNHARRKGQGVTFYHVDVMGLLAHPYLQEYDVDGVGKVRERIIKERRISVDAELLGCNDLMKVIFAGVDKWSDLSDYLLRVLKAVAKLPYDGDDADQRLEFLAVTAEEITKLRNSLDDCDVVLTKSIYNSLLRRHLQTVRIPFEGEPLEGIQVMGILETRTLDFKNVIVLSMTDDTFPGNRLAQSSYIPYNLKAAYSLPTPEHHEGVFAYYFYRLIQRAENVYMLYCSHADDKSTGEPSRYIRQLDYESGFDIRKIEVGVDVNLVETPAIEVEKDREVMQRLEMLLEGSSRQRTLSPTAFSKYVACPLRFYFYYVAKIKIDDEMAEEVDAPMFGTILHATAQILYTKVKNENHPGQMLQRLIRGGEVERAVVRAINENYLCNDQASEADYTGGLVLVKDIVVRYLKDGVMAYDIRHDDFTVTGLEEEVAFAFPFEGEGGRRVLFKGTADRIDMKDNGTLRVVDYKTSDATLDFKGMESLFYGSSKERLPNVLQILLYSMMLYHSRKVNTVPELYYVRDMNHNEGYSPSICEVVDKQRKCGQLYSEYSDNFEKYLRENLTELFDPRIPFRQCEDAETCRYCDFREICKR